MRLNGKDLGVVWTATWRVEITGLLPDEANKLEVEITNTRSNRNQGDAGLPTEKRFTKTNGTGDPRRRMMPSGLLGPVRLMREE